MSLKSSSDYLAAALIRAAQEERVKLPPIPNYTIALSREAGARGTSVARVIGALLDWPVYDNEILEHIAREMKLHPRRLADVDEKHANLLSEFVESFSAGPVVSAAGYLQHLRKTLLALGAEGNCVIVGRGAAQFLPAKTTLRVRLVGTREDRIEVMSRRLGVPVRAAARCVEEKDRERDLFVKHNFQKDPADSHQYDLVLNSSQFTNEECAAIIIEALHRLQTRAAARVSGTSPARAAVSSSRPGE